MSYEEIGDEIARESFEDALDDVKAAPDNEDALGELGRAVLGLLPADLNCALNDREAAEAITRQTLDEALLEANMMEAEADEGAPYPIADEFLVLINLGRAVLGVPLANLTSAMPAYLR